MRYVVSHDGRDHELEIDEREDGTFRVLCDGRELSCDFMRSENPALCSLLIDGRSYELLIIDDRGSTHVTARGLGVELRVESEREYNARKIAGEVDGGGAGDVVAVMPGIVVQVHVEPGQEVAKGDPVIVLEAMKMENEIRSPGAGVVRAVHVAKGQTVNGGDVLVEID